MKLHEAEEWFQANVQEFDRQLKVEKLNPYLTDKGMMKSDNLQKKQKYDIANFHFKKAYGML